MQGKPVKKLGAGSRATFISPYLRRPLRPLQKVLSEREEREDDATPAPHGEDSAETAKSAHWRLPRKSAVSD
jgi:hypothetical protein